MIRIFLSTLLVIFAVPLALGFFGRLHPAGDSLAVLRMFLTGIVAILSILVLLIKPRLLGGMGIALAILAGYSMVPPAPVSFVPEGARAYKVYQKNLLFLLPDTSVVANDIRESGADFVMLQELHSRNRGIFNELADTYPHRHFCPFSAVGGTAVLSKWPKKNTPSLCGEGTGLAAMQVDTPDGLVWVASLHLHWPYPYRQMQQLNDLLPLIDSMDQPTIIGGDFNMVPWSHAVQSIANATDSKLAGFAGSTFRFERYSGDNSFRKWLPGLPIDHVLIPKDASPISLKKRGKLGSDHHGLLAEFALR